VRSSPPAQPPARSVQLRRHDSGRTHGPKPQLIDTRLVRAELVRLRGPLPLSPVAPLSTVRRPTAGGEHHGRQ